MNSFDRSQEVHKGAGEVLYYLSHVPTPAVEPLQAGTHCYPAMVHLSKDLTFI